MDLCYPYFFLCKGTKFFRKIQGFAPRRAILFLILTVKMRKGGVWVRSGLPLKTRPNPLKPFIHRHFRRLGYLGRSSLISCIFLQYSAKK